MVDMTTTDNGLTRLIFNVPARGMIGYSTEFMSMTRGYGITNHTFEEFRPRIKSTNWRSVRGYGALISMGSRFCKYLCHFRT